MYSAQDEVAMEADIREGIADYLGYYPILSLSSVSFDEEAFATPMSQAERDRSRFLREIKFARRLGAAELLAKLSRDGWSVSVKDFDDLRGYHIVWVAPDGHTISGPYYGDICTYSQSSIIDEIEAWVDEMARRAREEEELAERKARKARKVTRHFGEMCCGIRDDAKSMGADVKVVFSKGVIRLEHELFCWQFRVDPDDMFCDLARGEFLAMVEDQMCQFLGINLQPHT